LHDVGHGILSHISENNFKKSRLIKEIKASDKRFSGAKPHEIMSYLIVRGYSFKNVFQKHIKPHYNELYSVDLDRIAGYIIGYADSDKKYLADIINSAFDADKLDYIARDSYFAGLRLNVDIERLLYSMAVLKKPNGTRCLAVKASGVQALEQVMFSKMILYCSLYHHQKVRAADSMLNTYVEYVKENYGAISGSPRLLEPWQFIRYIDADVLCPSGHSNEFLKRIVERIAERRIYKRALIISPKTISKGLLYKITRLKDASDKEERLNAYARKIYDLIPADDRGNMTRFEIIIDIPDDPSLRESQQCLVIDKISDDGSKYQVLNKYFPVDDWLTAYYANKWMAHVFCPPEMQKVVNNAARIFFYEQFEIVFSEQATTFARIDYSPIEYKGKKGSVLI
jgi:HD superfamily phosphohydrolase